MVEPPRLDGSFTRATFGSASVLFRGLHVGRFSPSHPRFSSPLGKRRARCLRLGAAAPAASQLPQRFRAGDTARLFTLRVCWQVGAGRGLRGPPRSAPPSQPAAKMFLFPLDIVEHLRYYVGALPVSVLRHPPARVSVRRRKKSSFGWASFFACSERHFCQVIRPRPAAVSLATQGKFPQ